MTDPQQLCQKCMRVLPAIGAACPRCGSRNADIANLPHQLPCGAILLGKYWIGGVLGQGGFGITYIGYDLSLGVRVAIKEYYPNNIVTRGAGDPAVQPVHDTFTPAFSRGRERFLEEARALAQFSNERGVVNVREFFLENNTAYIVMDFVDGKTLKAVAAESGGKLPAREVLAMLRPVTRTLSRIHDAGLVHRDISPDNIILQPDGTAVLIDFGAARQISSTGSKSLTINVKHGYAPEEQYRRRGKQGPWTDVYALCATVYRLTTGKKPPQALDRLVANDPLAPPNERGANLTPMQQRAILKGLSVHAEDRPQDMRALCELLYRDSGGVSRFFRKIQQNKRTAVPAMFSLLAVGLGLFLFLRANGLRKQAEALLANAASVASPAPTAKTPLDAHAATPVPIFSEAAATPVPEAVTPSPSPTPTPEAMAALERPGIVTSNQLLVRHAPSLDEDSVFATLRLGDVVELIQKQNNFYYIFAPSLNVRGYVRSEYIETEYEAEVPKVKTPVPVTPTPSPVPTPTPAILDMHRDSGYTYTQPTQPPYALLTPSPTPEPERGPEA